MAEQSKTIICLKCQHVNSAEAKICEKCGTALKITTVPVPDIKKELAQQAEAPVTKKKTDELVKQIALWVRNEPKPVLITIGRGHVLGRKTSASDPPDLIDLTDYGAYRLGVSRRHSQFECTEDSCIVIDLGSSNGTWVNGLRLEPYQPASVKSGDRINLGRMEFSIGYALSDAPPTAPPPETVAKTDPHLLPVLSSTTSSGKADTDPVPKLQQPASTAKDTAEHPKLAQQSDAKPTGDKPASTTHPAKPESDKKPSGDDKEPPKSDA